MAAIVGKKDSVIQGIQVAEVDNCPFAALWKEQKQNVWFAEEINLQTDMKDYAMLTPEEKALFYDLVGYFVTSELLVQNVLTDVFLPYVVHPRVRIAMSAQIFMESIHEDFFEAVLNTFDMDRDAIYAKARNNPFMKEKQQLVAGAADGLSDINPDTLEGQKSILRAILINNIIQEGTFFYSAFALFFSMRETNKMKNVNNGVDLILIDESFHLKLGVEMILGMIDHNPALAEDTAFVQDIQDIMIRGTEIELRYLQSVFADHTIFGLAYAEMEQYLKYITDRRLEELGLDPYYHIASHPLTFLEKQDMMTLQNFFETTNVNYTNF